jgi:hypothetical protein
MEVDIFERKGDDHKMLLKNKISLFKIERSMGKKG